MPPQTTRQSFWQMSTQKKVLFVVLGLIALLVIGWAVSATRDRLSYGVGQGGTVSVSSGMAPSMGMATREGYYEKGVASDLPYSAPDRMPIVPPWPTDSGNVVAKDRQVIKNGTLDILVKDAEDTATKIEATAKKYEGFLDSANIYEISEDIKAGTIVVRVQSEKFSEALAELKTLALKVKHETVSSEDVTGQIVDLEANLKNARVEEEQYRGIMARASKIEDILNVAQRLAEVRGRIESLTAQLNYLNRRVDLSTITINLTAEPEVEIFGIVWEPLTTVKLSFRNMLEGLKNLVDRLISIIFSLPVLIIFIGLIALGVYIVWRIAWWLKRKLDQRFRN